jgi:hypothetical protein
MLAIWRRGSVKASDITTAGNIHGLLHIHGNAPPTGGTVLSASVVAGTSIEISMTADVRLRIQLKQLTSLRTATLLGPPLNYEGIVDIPIWVKWDWIASVFQFRLFDSVWFDAAGSYDLVLDLPVRPDSLPQVHLVTEGEAERIERAAVAARRSAQAHFAKTIDELTMEIAQLNDLIGLIPARPHHVRGAINIVRKLIADRPGLIQLAAGKYDAELTVFASATYPPPPEYDIGADLVAKISFTSPGAFRLNLDWGFRFATDLDRWLADEDTILNGRRITNRDFIKSIADKIGAHNDLNSRETIEMLMLHGDGRSATHTSLHSYVLDLAAATAALGERVLQKSVLVEGGL